MSGETSSSVGAGGCDVYVARGRPRGGPWSDGERAGRAQPDEPGEKRLVAYYTATEAAEAVRAEQLRAHLRERLPQYMVLRRMYGWRHFR